MKRDIGGIYRKWLKYADDQILNSELNSITESPEEIDNRFYKDLEFGTGGLRGVLGAGTACMNIYTVRKATAGLADYLNSIGGGSVAISYDSRINSRLFAENAAMVLASRGIKAHLSAEIMPTPFLSYAVRSLGAAAGIMVTASHNPAKYNGYKVYGADGCQMTESAAQAVTKYIGNIDAFSVKLCPLEHYIEKGDIQYIPQSLTESYIEEVTAQSLNTCEGLNVTYTPLNGTGYKLVPRVLRQRGITTLSAVSGQDVPDGNFPTCPYPNPEKREALTLGLAEAQRQGSDLLIATDPDADRVGIAVRTERGYELMTGNEVGVLLTDYLLFGKKSAGTLPAHPIVIKTIVTTSLTEKVAADYGAKVLNVLTGFKYIGEQIALLEEKGSAERFILGFEESYGYLAGTYVRDKDAVVAAMLICEMAALYKRQGKTLKDRMQEIYSTYGKYSHKLVTKEFSGASGSRKMQQLLNALRNARFTEIEGLAVNTITDYLNDDTGLPKSDVIAYKLQENAEFIVRPSGTEPLIKFYLTAAGTDDQNDRVFAALGAFIDKFFA